MRVACVRRSIRCSSLGREIHLCTCSVCLRPSILCMGEVERNGDILSLARQSLTCKDYSQAPTKSTRKDSRHFSASRTKLITTQKLTPPAPTSSEHHSTAQHSTVTRQCGPVEFSLVSRTRTRNRTKTRARDGREGYLVVFSREHRAPTRTGCEARGLS